MVPVRQHVIHNVLTDQNPSTAPNPPANPTSSAFPSANVIHNVLTDQNLGTGRPATVRSILGATATSNEVRQSARTTTPPNRRFSLPS